MSAGHNFAEITNICGCMPSLLIEGKPGTGKSTMTTLLSNLFNCTKNASVLVINDISQSALENLTQRVTGIPIWYVYSFSIMHYIKYILIYSLDDCDQNKLLKISKTLWQDTASTNVNITNKHGVRAGARAVTIGICNYYEMAVDLKPESIRRRVFVLMWKDFISKMNAEQERKAKISMETYLDGFKGKALSFFRDLNLSKQHVTYFTRLMKMYDSFTHLNTLRKVIPQTMLQFQALVLQILHYCARKIIIFDPTIIDMTHQNIIHDTFKV